MSQTINFRILLQRGSLTPRGIGVMEHVLNKSISKTAILPYGAPNSDCPASISSTRKPPKSPLGSDGIVASVASAACVTIFAVSAFHSVDTARVL